MLKQILKKVLSSVAAVTMAVTVMGGVGSSIPVEAATGSQSGTITITSAVEGKTYNVYKIFDLESYDTTAKAYLYKVNSKFSDFFTTGAGKDLITVDSQGYVTKIGTNNNASDAEALAAALKTYIDTQNASATVSDHIAADGTANGQAAGTATTIDVTSLGYYLVTTTTGSLCGLDTTNPNASIREKNGVPTVDKTVQEDSKVVEANAAEADSASDGDGTTGYQKKNDANIGQTVYFKTVITVQSGATNYVLHDTATGISLDSTTNDTTGYAFVDSIKVGGADVTNTNYTVSAPTTTAAEGSNPLTSSFTITFDNDYVSGLAANTEITVLYHGTVDASATVGGTGNPNETYLNYGASQSSNHSTTHTYTWKINVFKYYNNASSEQTALANVEFKLFNSDGTQVANVTDGKFTSFADITPSSASDLSTVTNGTTLKTDENGYISVAGLDEGTYELVETKAVDGFAKLTKPIIVTITSTNGTGVDDEEAVTTGANKTYTVKYKNQGDADDTNASTNTADNYANQVDVENTPISPLPVTGGAGTRAFYIIGAMLVAAAAVLLISKRRKA